MKKYQNAILPFLICLTILILCSVTVFADKNIGLRPAAQVSDEEAFTKSIVYNSFEEMINAGEQIYCEEADYTGYLDFESSYRIGNTEKFKVTYIENKDAEKAFSKVIVYNSFEEMINAGEQIYCEEADYIGNLSFESAYRTKGAGSIDKFRVTYVEEIQ